MGRVLLERLPLALKSKLQNVGDAVTVDQGDRYIRYENNGLCTPSGRVLIDFYRRFKNLKKRKVKAVEV